MEDTRLMKIGGVSALVWVALQVVGNILHPQLPEDTTTAMARIAGSNVWGLAHLILIFDYFVIIPMIVGIAAAFRPIPWMVRIGVPLVTIAVAAGVTQAAIHPTVLKILSEKYIAANDPSIREYLVMLYDGVWTYNIALEAGHLLVIYLVIVLFGIAMLGASLFPKWVAWLGAIGGVLGAIALIIGEMLLGSSILGDWITFGFGLAPLAVWLVAVGVILLRSKLEAENLSTPSS